MTISDQDDSLTYSILIINLFFFSSRRRHTRFDCDWSSDVCSSDLIGRALFFFSSRRRHTRFDCDSSSDVCSSDVDLVRRERQRGRPRGVQDRLGGEQAELAEEPHGRVALARLARAAPGVQLLHHALEQYDLRLDRKIDV